jgi:hypothetical protein
MDILGSQLRRMVDDRLREMYRHFAEQALPPQIGKLLESVDPRVSFAYSRQKHCDADSTAVTSPGHRPNPQSSPESC